MKLGTLLAAALLLGGCFLPQEDDVLDPLPQRNRPPRILEQNVQPAQNYTTGTDCTIDFSANVDDPDVDDRITYRWYVDYEGTNTETRAPFEEKTLKNTGAAIRDESAKWSISTGSAFTPLSQEGVHRVTLMVFDGTLGTFDGPGTQPPADPVEGVDGGNPRYSDSLTWEVKVSPTFACPSP